MSEVQPTETVTTFKVYAGNLPYSTTDETLKAFFAPAADVVEAHVITRGNRSLGYGFVDFQTQEQADKAVKELHLKDFEGRSISVESAKPRAEPGTRTRRRRTPGNRRLEVGQEGAAAPAEGGEARAEGGERRGRGRGRGRGGYRGGHRAAEGTAAEQPAGEAAEPHRGGRGGRRGGRGGHRGGHRAEGGETRAEGETGEHQEEHRPRRRRQHPAEHAEGENAEHQEGRRPRRRHPRAEHAEGETGEHAEHPRRRRHPRAEHAEGETGEHAEHAAPRARRPRRPVPENQTPSQTTLFITNLPYSVEDEGLLQIFQSYQPKQARVARFRGRSKGFGFVELASHELQQKALELDNSENQGRALTVKVAFVDLSAPRPAENGEAPQAQ